MMDENFSIRSMSSMPSISSIHHNRVHDLFARNYVCAYARGPMKAIILAGGFGTRLAEVTGVIPKPMVEIGGKPILWHIMNIYAHYGITEFIIALGYKSEVVK